MSGLRRFHYYHTGTGMLHGKYVTTNQVHGAEEFANANAPTDHAVVEGFYDSATHAFDLTEKRVVQRPLPSEVRIAEAQNDGAAPEAGGAMAAEAET